MPVSEIIKKNFVKVESEDWLSHAIGQLTLKKQSEALVFQKNKFLGILDKRKFIRIRQDPSKTKIRGLVTKVPKLTPSTSFTEAARLLNTADMHCLPVMKGAQVIGICHFADVLKKLKAKISNIKISEIIKTPIILNQNDPISKALNTLKQKKISRIPVVDNAGKLIGIVSETDLIKKYFSFTPWKPGAFGKPGMKSHPAKERNTTRLPIKNEIEPVVYTLTKENTVKQALEIMAKQKIASIVIVDGEIPIGIVTAKDIFRLVSA